jgi:21S rRNA (GM2251-2'-O)-methyltransferase
MKASAGAAEALPVFKTGQPTEFLNKSAQAGWKIYAADTIPPAPASLTSAAETEEGKEGKDTKVVYTINKSSKRLPAEHSPVGENPTILMLGAEGTGLKTSLLNLAHYKVGIPHGRDVDEVGVDSLNVSVAASILCYEMLQRPGKAVEKAPEDILF